VYDREAVWQLGEMIRQEIEGKPFVIDPIVVKMTVSVGVCHCDDLTQRFSMRECLAKAMQRMLKAKEQGRNRIFPPKGTSANQGQ
jgi:GGDEF domain-containing protein